ncbi:hypothetical protein I551_8905 [Mycobacterium ulcerans str. Harvey]|uniref:Uncharacterized protein n=1 Tax=Mycobacterium ulcerans str. Harvey TaxID=1299332 RepID=A0ABN0R9Q5_MYCUL|nr:hypothetical protein I551_8905 [Mycobacterium ulcerans str. Harvey]
MNSVYVSLQQQIGTRRSEATPSMGWLRLGALVLVAAALAALLINRRLPT